jgi:hypothetical protein
MLYTAEPGGRVDAADLANRFTYHPPVDHDQAEKYVTIRSHAHGLATLINEHAPDSREKSLAITSLEEAVFWANAAIARHEPHVHEPQQGGF